MMTSPRVLLKAWNIRAKKKSGQSFLSDPSTARTIVARSNFDADDVILEIGAGLGALTVPLAQVVKKVYAVEIDPQLIELLKTELLVNHISNCDIIARDILKMNLKDFAETSGRKIIVAGNLPYHISSQILVKLILARRVIERAVLMFQKELAQRIRAQPGTKNYGRISAMLRYGADVHHLLAVKPAVFYPAPKVDSEVLEIRFKATTTYDDHDEIMLYKVIKAAFGNRRKTLKNALIASGVIMDSQIALDALEAAGIDPDRRAESLEPSEFVALEISLRSILTKMNGTPQS
jgi:16S rRNA (adenine1518-N6/adenine1519-N6)-dimethyltransferase